MSNVNEIVKDFFKDCPILDDNSTRGEIVKFLLKILLFLQIYVVNFRLPVTVVLLDIYIFVICKFLKGFEFLALVSTIYID